MAKVVYNKLLFYQVSIFLVLYVGYGFYYYTRKSIVFMLPHFDRANTSGINSIQISKNDIGIIISSQNTAYALSKLIGGFLTDVVSCRILFGAGLLLSGLFNIAFKKDIQIYMIYALSFLIGLAQGAGWPCCGKLLQNWFSPKKLGTFWSILSTSANVAGAIGPLVATSIALKYHWSYGFMIPGCICMTVGYLSLIILRNRPSEIGLEDFDSSVDENISTLYKNDGKTDEDTSSLSSIDSESEDEEEELGALQRTKLYLNYPYFISICLSFFIVTLIKTLMSDWSQVYLIKSIRVDHYNASYFVSLFELSGIIGSVVSGILTDYIFSRQSTANKPMESIRIRMTVNLVYIFILVVSLHLFTFYLDSTSNRLLLFTIAFLMGFLCYGSVNLLGICAMEFAPNKYSGSSHAVAALAANIGAVFAGIPFGFLSKLYSWSFAFLCVELLSIFIGLFSFLARNRMCKFEIISRERKIK